MKPHGCSVRAQYSAQLIIRCAGARSIVMYV
jgi:hypothetical protein